MPVFKLEERQSIPRSALRYQPLSADQAGDPDPRVMRRSRARADVHTTASTIIPDDFDLEEEQPLYRRRSVPRAQAAPPGRVKRRFHGLFYVGLALLIMLFGWVAFSALGSWWQTALDDWHYGRPRTFQIDVVVGHHDSTQNPSHFIAMNLNRHVVIIEIPGGDVSKSIVFSGPTLLGPGQDLAPVTLTFRDVNHDGLLDMVATIQGSQIVWLNAQGSFHPFDSNS